MAPRSPTRVDGYAPIRDYALVGNRRTAAVIALDGTIDWLCLPQLDSPSVFGALLDSRAGGRFALAPTVPFEVERRYLPDTNVLETTFHTAEGVVKVTDALTLPLARTIPWNEVVRRVDGVSGTVPMAWSMQPRFDYARARGTVEWRQGAPVVRDPGTRLLLLLQSFDAGEPERHDDGLRGTFEAREGSVGVLVLGAFQDEPVTLSDRDEALDRLEATTELWRLWSKGVEYEGMWRDAVLRSALALDLLVDSDTGAIAAAATMGLPERIGGPRNFDYRYAWVRDLNLTLEAMLRLRLRDRVHASLSWMLAAASHTHPRLRPMYLLDGRVRLPNQELPLPGYRDSRPVTLGNSAQEQVQLGNFGDVLDMTWHFVRDGHTLDPLNATRIAELASFASRIWSNEDASIWELGDTQQYTQGKLAIWLALERARQLAEAGEIPGDDEPRWRGAQEQIRRFVEERCWSEQLGAYARSAGQLDQLDASVLLASRGAFVEDQRERFSSTIDAIRRELGAGGPLLYRYSGMGDEEGAFLACSFWLVEALAVSGRMDEAVETMDALVAVGSDVGLFSEEVDPSSGELLGNIPQALTHLALVNAAHRLKDIGGE